MYTAEIPINSQEDFLQIKALINSLAPYLAGEIVTKPYLHIIATSEAASTVLRAIFAPDATLAQSEPADPISTEPASEPDLLAPKAARRVNKQPKNEHSQDSNETAACEGCGEPYIRTRSDQRFKPGHATCRNKVYNQTGRKSKKKNESGTQEKEWRIESTHEEIEHKDLSQRLTFGKIQMGEKIHHRSRGDYEVIVGRGYKYTLRRLG